MIYVKHRQNKIIDLFKLNTNYGAEIDVRSSKKKLVIHHDPFNEGEDFEKWIKNYNHRYLIVNIKEEGIEKKIISILNKNYIKNYFLLDVTVPMINKLNQSKFYKIALRISKFEGYLNIFNFNNKNKWLWIDSFDKKFPINNKQILDAKNKKFKLCLVSPELITNNKIDINFFYNKNKKLIQNMDMICTKFPEYWEGFKFNG